MIYPCDSSGTLNQTHTDDFTLTIFFFLYIFVVKDVNDAKNRANALSGQMLAAVDPVSSRIHDTAAKTRLNYSKFDIFSLLQK